MSKHFSRVTASNLTNIVHDVATFNALLSYRLPFRYSNLFRNGSATKKIFFPRKTPTFRLSLVAMATSLEQFPNECQI